MEYIYLNDEQRSHVRGIYYFDGIGYSLEPFQYGSGWTVPIKILESSECESIREYLLTLPIIEVTDEELI